MQSLVPDLLDLSRETRATQTLYGIDSSIPSKRLYGIQCLRARRLVEAIALAMQAALMLKRAPQAGADAFIASRLAQEGGHAFGTLPPSDFTAIIARAAIG